MISSAIHVLIMTPVIFVMMKKRALKKGTLKYSGTKDCLLCFVPLHPPLSEKEPSPDRGK